MFKKMMLKKVIKSIVVAIMGALVPVVGGSSEALALSPDFANELTSMLNAVLAFVLFMLRSPRDEK